MEAQERALLERCMAAMAAGDAAFVFTFIEHFGGHLAGFVRRVVGEMGRRDILAEFTEVDGLVQDCAFFLFDHAAAWNPDGALPWVWAERGLRSEISIRVGHRVVAAEDDLESEASAAAPIGDVALGLDDIAGLAQRHPELALALEAIAEVSSERDRQVFLQYRLQHRMGDRSPSQTVAAMFDLSPANARQIHHRVGKLLDEILKRDRFRAVAHLPLLAA